jgi:hypothetical protein
MTGQRRANWRTEATQMVAQLDARLLVRIEAAEGLATRRFDHVGSVLDAHVERIVALERKCDALLKLFSIVAVPVALLTIWAVTR